MNDKTYAGDVLPADAWEALKDDARALLIDVRTEGEYEFVGHADLTSIEKRTPLVEWMQFPSGDTNPRFEVEIETLVADKETPLYFICRSGVRSRHAAVAMTARGYSICYNVAHGFEGDMDDNGHRGTLNGWKVSALPWVQG